MESALYLLIRVNANASVRNDLYLSKEYHISRSEILQMPYYIYEQYLVEVQLIQKEEEKERKKQEKEQSLNMPKTPTIPKFATPKMPTVSMPKF